MFVPRLSLRASSVGVGRYSGVALGKTRVIILDILPYSEYGKALALQLTYASISFNRRHIFYFARAMMTLELQSK